MKTYKISETKEFRANENSYAIVHKYKIAPVYTTITLDKRELLTLYQAIQDEVLNRR